MTTVIYITYYFVNNDNFYETHKTGLDLLQMMTTLLSERASSINIGLKQR